MSFVIPAYFKAFDGISHVVDTMTAHVKAFGEKTEVALARSERSFNKFMPSMSGATKEMFKFAETAAITAGVIATIDYSVEKIKEFDKAQRDLRNVLGDMSAGELAEYKTAIFEVAKETKKSSIEITEAFEKVIQLRPELRKLPGAIGELAESSVILKEALGGELSDAVNTVNTALTQYNLGTKEADRVTNVLVASHRIGTYTLEKMSDGFTKLAPAAKLANLSFEQSAAALQIFSHYNIEAGDAGGILSRSILRLQKANIGYVDGQFSLAAALEQTHKHLEKLHTAHEKDIYLQKIFGAKNAANASILLSNIDNLKEYTKAITGTSDAHEQAERNMGSLGGMIERLKDKWTNIITGSDKTSNSLRYVSKAIGYVTDHMEQILAVGAAVIGFFITWKTVMMVTEGVMWIVRTASLAWTAAQWLLNVALTANPIGIVIVAIGALIAFIAIVVSHTKGWGETWKSVTSFMGALWDVFSLSLKLDWEILQEAFYVLTDAIVLAWEWAQNKMGKLSDEQYEKDKENIMRGHKERLQMIKENTIKYIDAVKTVGQGIDWKVQWDDGEQKAGNDIVTPINPKVQQQKIIDQYIMMGQTKNTAEITIKDESGKASVTKNTGIPIKLTPTLAQF